MAEITELKVVINGETVSLTRALEEADKGLQKTGNEAEQTGSKFHHLFEQIKSGIGTGVGAGIGLELDKGFAGLLQLGPQLVNGLLAITKEASDTGLQIYLLGQRFGFTAEQASTWLHVGQQFGLTTQSMMRAFSELQTRMFAAAANNPFDKFGVSITDTQGKLLPLQTVIGNLGARLDGIVDPTTRAAVASEFLGARYSALLPVIEAMGGGGFQRATDALHRMGLIMSQEDVQAAVQMHLAFGGVSQAIEGMKETVATALMPALSQLAGIVIQLAQQALPYLKAAADAVTGALLGLLQGLGVVVNLKDLVPAFITAGESAKQAADGTDAAAAGLNNVGDAAKAATVAFKDQEYALQEQLNTLGKYRDELSQTVAIMDQQTQALDDQLKLYDDQTSSMKATLGLIRTQGETRLEWALKRPILEREATSAAMRGALDEKKASDDKVKAQVEQQQYLTKIQENELQHRLQILQKEQTDEVAAMQLAGRQVVTGAQGTAADVGKAFGDVFTGAKPAQWAETMGKNIRDDIKKQDWNGVVNDILGPLFAGMGDWLNAHQQQIADLGNAIGKTLMEGAINNTPLLGLLNRALGVESREVGNFFSGLGSGLHSVWNAPSSAPFPSGTQGRTGNQSAVGNYFDRPSATYIAENEPEYAVPKSLVPTFVKAMGGGGSAGSNYHITVNGGAQMSEARMRWMIEDVLTQHTRRRSASASR